MKLYRAMGAEEYMKLQNGEKLENHTVFPAGEGFFFFGEEVSSYYIGKQDLESIGVYKSFKFFDRTDYYTDENNHYRMDLLNPLIEKLKHSNETQKHTAIYMLNSTMNYNTFLDASDILVEFETTDDIEMTEAYSIYTYSLANEFRTTEYDKEKLIPRRCIYGKRFGEYNGFSEEDFEDFIVFEDKKDLLRKCALAPEKIDFSKKPLKKIEYLNILGSNSDNYIEYDDESDALISRNAKGGENRIERMKSLFPGFKFKSGVVLAAVLLKFPELLDLYHIEKNKNDNFSFLDEYMLVSNQDRSKRITYKELFIKKDGDYRLCCGQDYIGTEEGIMELDTPEIIDITEEVEKCRRKRMNKDEMNLKNIASTVSNNQKTQADNQR